MIIMIMDLLNLFKITLMKKFFKLLIIKDISMKKKSLNKKI